MISASRAVEMSRSRESSIPHPRRRRDVDRRYHGEFKDGKPNGFGKMRYASGASHRGLWVGGEREGSGVFVDADGVKFDGAWTHDMPSAAE